MRKEFRQNIIEGYLQQFMTGDKWERIHDVAATGDDELEWKLEYPQACQFLSTIAAVCLASGEGVWDTIEFYGYDTPKTLEAVTALLKKGGIEVSCRPWDIDRDESQIVSGDVEVGVAVTPEMAEKLLEVKKKIDKKTAAGTEAMKKVSKLTGDEADAILDVISGISESIAKGEMKYQLTHNNKLRQITTWLEKILVERKLVLPSSEPRGHVLSEETRYAIERRLHDFIARLEPETRAKGEIKNIEDFEEQFAQKLYHIAADELAQKKQNRRMAH